MPVYSLTVETTSNANTGNALQWLMPAAKDCQLIAVFIKPQQLTNTQESGQWVVDRISAVASGSSLVPTKMDARSPASAITDTAKTISTTLAATNTQVDVAILELQDGWNWFTDPNLGPVDAGINQGFAVRRATAPTGAQVVDVLAIWKEY